MPLVQSKHLTPKREMVLRNAFCRLLYTVESFFKNAPQLLGTLLHLDNRPQLSSCMHSCFCFWLFQLTWESTVCINVEKLLEKEKKIVHLAYSVWHTVCRKKSRSNPFKKLIFQGKKGWNWTLISLFNVIYDQRSLRNFFILFMVLKCWVHFCVLLQGKCVGCEPNLPDAFLSCFFFFFFALRSSSSSQNSPRCFLFSLQPQSFTSH